MLLLGLAIGFLLGYEVGKMLGPRGAVLELTIVFGSEKQGWIEAVIPRFERENPNVTVNGVPMGSRESINQILHGQITPTIWSPASTIWIPLANWLWTDMHPDDVAKYGPLVSEWHPLVHSPIVIVSWQEFADQFNIAGFQSLYSMAASENKTQLRFAHTNPQLSNSGMMAMVLETAVAANKTPSELTLEDLKRSDVKEWLTTLESTAVDYDPSTGWLIKKMVSRGPTEINVVIAYENLVIEQNGGGEPSARWNQNLTAVYPDGGTLSSDHPFCILNASWVTEEQRKAALDFLQFLLSPEIQVEAIEYGFRPENEAAVSDPLYREKFNPDFGVKQNVTVPILRSDIDGEVLRRMTDLWLVCRAYGD